MTVQYLSYYGRDLMCLYGERSHLHLASLVGRREVTHTLSGALHFTY